MHAGTATAENNGSRTVLECLSCHANEILLSFGTFAACILPAPPNVVNSTYVDEDFITNICIDHFGLFPCGDVKKEFVRLQNISLNA